MTAWSRVRIFCLAALLIVCCGLLSAQEQISIVVSSNADSVDFGGFFDIEVERTWPSTMETDALHGSALGLPTAQEISRTARTEDGVITEVQVFRCFAFRLSEVRIPPLRFDVRNPSDGSFSTVESNEVVVAVESVLPAGDKGEMELPRGLFEGIGRDGVHPAWYVIIALTLGGLGFVVFRSRRGFQGEEAWSVTEVRAALTSLSQDSSLASRVFYGRLVESVRLFLHHEHSLKTEEMTTDQIVAGAQSVLALTTEEDEKLGLLMRRCDSAVWGDSEFDQGSRLEDLQVVENLLWERHVAMPPAAPGSGEAAGE